MKTLHITFFTLLFVSAFSQNESVYFSIGKPWYPDKMNNLNNYSLGLNYQNRFAQSFGINFNLEYSQSNDFPTFYEDSNALNEFLVSQTFDGILMNSLWSKISSVNFDSKINYLFVNNKKFNFNFNAGIGYMFTKSSAHYLKSWSYEPESGQIISYENETISDSLNTFYYTLGLQFQYTFYKDYFIGINPYYLMTIGEKKINTIPVYPNFYNLTFNIGKKF